MSLSESKCWYSSKSLHFLHRAVPLTERHYAECRGARSLASLGFVSFITVAASLEQERDAKDEIIGCICQTC
jgi:hypothetical protein